jgi:superfamily II DNA/RNA helicase
MSQSSARSRTPISGRPARSGGDSAFRSRRPRRPSGGSGRSSRPAAAPQTSPLDAALDAAAAAPAPELASFAELGLPEALTKTLARRGMAAPFAIQTRVLPDALAGRDVLGRAQTGSGKTLAFGLPVLARLAGGQRRPQQPRAVILVPTRELARQVTDAMVPLAEPMGMRIGTVVGGLSIGKQVDVLRRGVDVIVATPGRLIDLMERRSADLSAVQITVLDEADHMADLGFLPAVRRILDATPSDAQRLLLSATLDGGVGRLVSDYLTDPAFHAVAKTPDAAAEMDHKVLVLRHDDKVDVASRIATRPARTLFFVRTKHGADRLAKQLSRAGAEAAAIHGNLSQNQRQRALDAFAAGHPRVLVATDVAARGIHVDDVDLVVHFDLPADHKDYLHRSGRTARAGNRGTVVAFAEPSQTRDLERLHRAASVTASTDQVFAGQHEAVDQLATSGEPVVVKERAADRPAREGDERPRNRRGGPGPGGPRRGPRPARDGDRQDGGFRDGGPRGDRFGRGPVRQGASSGGPRRPR